VFSVGQFNALPRSAGLNCTLTPGTIQTQESLAAASASFNCRYPDGWAFMAERFGRESADDSAALAEFLEPDFNMGVSFAFAIGLVIANFLLYLVPLPAFVKAKFRE